MYFGAVRHDKHVLLCTLPIRNCLLSVKIVFVPTLLLRLIHMGVRWHWLTALYRDWKHIEGKCWIQKVALLKIYILRIYWRSPLTKYYWWISKFTKSDFKFMEILTISNKSCQCDQISIHDNRRTYEGFFKCDFNYFYMLFHENVIEPPFGFNIFLQYAFNLEVAFKKPFICTPIVMDGNLITLTWFIAHC
jgi:hypothetical protein